MEDMELDVLQVIVYKFLEFSTSLVTIRSPQMVQLSDLVARLINESTSFVRFSQPVALASELPFRHMSIH